jgi:hypothetical protein
VQLGHMLLAHRRVRAAQETHLSGALGDTMEVLNFDFDLKFHTDMIWFEFPPIKCSQWIIYLLNRFSILRWIIYLLIYYVT